MLSHMGALVAEAARDAPPLPHLTERANIARLVWAMLHISGTLNFGRNWTEYVGRVFERAGLPAPSAKLLCAQKYQMKQEPRRWSEYAPDPALVDDVLSGMA